MGEDNIDWVKFISKLNSENSNEYCSLKAYFFSLSPKQFSLLSSLIGIALIDNLDTNQKNSFGNFLVNVGQVLLTSAAQVELIQSKSENNNSANQ